MVITDINMPRLNGIELYIQLLQERPGIRALLMTGADHGALTRAGVDLLVLLKPFAPNALVKKVRELLAAS
jgi:DNA-binding NarL/FixJ family response regulator